MTTDIVVSLSITELLIGLNVIHIQQQADHKFWSLIFSCASDQPFVTFIYSILLKATELKAQAKVWCWKSLY